MSEEKNTTMPEGFDMSFAQDLGVGSKKTTTPELSLEPQVVVPTNDAVTVNIYEDLTHDHNSDVNVESNADAVNSQITDAVTQVNTDVIADAPDIAQGNLYQNVPNPNELTSEASSYNIYEDLTHDHAPVEEATTTHYTPNANETTEDNAMENVVWESEGQMDAYFDGNVQTNENEDLSA